MIVLRRATWGDVLFIRRLRNDEGSRKWSRSKDRVSLSRHVKWWRQFSDSGGLIFVVMDGSHRIGYVRCSPTMEGTTTVSIAIRPGSQGRGVGTEAIRQAITASLDVPGVRGWIAMIDRENEASLIAFRRAGFRLAAECTSSDDAFLKLELTRDEWVARKAPVDGE